MKSLVDYLCATISICGIVTLLSINSVFVTAECPDYGVAVSDCPSAPAPYNNGNCAGNSQICPTRGELAVYQGNYTLVTKSNFHIASNSTPICYVVRTCHIQEQEDVNGNYFKVCVPDIETTVGYAYVEGQCPG
jgi:hypothetical protein